MSYQILETRERRIAIFNITGREYVVRMEMPEEGLGYGEVYERVHSSIEGGLPRNVLLVCEKI